MNDSFFVRILTSVIIADQLHGVFGSMNANKKSLSNIFDPSLRLVVPLFQRPYVWKQDRNWQPLWESIKEVAERRLDNKPRTHFLGAIVLDQMKVSTGDIDTRLIIDGQQRMTTLQILLAALRDLCKAAGDDRYFKAFSKLTTNDVPLSDEADDEFKVWPTNADRSHFRAVLKAGSLEKVRSSFNLLKKANDSHDKLIPSAYLYFYETLLDWLGPTTEPGFAEKLKVLWQAIKDDMHVVVIDLDDNDDAQVIFETLNALGTPLLPADLIKNFLFQSTDLKNENIEGIYEKYWKPFDQGSAFWREEVRQGRLKRPRIDLFLQHYLTLKKGDEIPATHLFSEFKDLASKDPAVTAKEHLQSIHEYGEIFRQFMSGFSNQTPEGRFFYRLNELDTTTVYPVLLEVFKRAGGTPTEEVRSVLRDLESFLVRRMICGLTTKNYNVLMRSLIQYLQSINQYSAKDVRDFLLVQDAESTRWPTDEEFEKAWLNRPIYNALSRARVRIVLEALEMEMYTNKTEKITIDSKLTIEHILPQAWESYWPLSSTSSAEEATMRREQLIHVIGNLTLATDSLNPLMSNNAWASKKSELEKHAALAMNRKLITLNEWNEEAIESRSRELFDLAKRIWPRPSISASGEGELKATETLGQKNQILEKLKEELKKATGAKQESSPSNAPKKKVHEADGDTDSVPTGKDYTKFDVTLDEITHKAMPKRKAILAVVKHLCKQGVPPEEIEIQVPWRGNLFCSMEGIVASKEFVAQQKEKVDSGDARRYFCEDNELIHFKNKTYALTNGWGTQTSEAIENVLAKFPDRGVMCVKHVPVAGEDREDRKWDEKSFYSRYAELHSPEMLQACQKLCDLLKAGVKKIEFGAGKENGNFTPCYDDERGKQRVVNISTNGRIGIGFGGMKAPPFSDIALRKEFLERLNQVPGINLSIDNYTQWPNFKLSEVVGNNGLDKLIEVVDWARKQIVDSRLQPIEKSKPVTA